MILMGYNPEFKIDPDQLELIENALRAEMGRLAKPSPTYLDANCEKSATAKEIRNLLGHLHNQKRWYRPKEPVPMG